MSLLAELKRRKVFKVGGGYLVAACLVVPNATKTGIDTDIVLRYGYR
jgi:hypothetical protein